MVTITTRIYNPGIADRLGQDVVGFSRYGFEFHHHHNRDPPSLNKDTKQNNSSTDCDYCYGILTNTNRGLQKKNTFIRIIVANVALMSSIGPFLRALVRLCIDPIDPQSLFVLVDIDDTTTTTTTARSIAHGIHMMIRNSMGAGLFLNVSIMLPIHLSKVSLLKVMASNTNGCYEYPSIRLLERQHLDNSNEGDWNVFLSDENEKKMTLYEIDLGINITKPVVQIPPSTKETQFESSQPQHPPVVTKPLTTHCLDGYNSSKHVLTICLKTRMCTVRFTPVLYHLANHLLKTSFQNNKGPSFKQLRQIQPLTHQSISLRPDERNQQNMESVLLVFCLEQPSNMFRVFMIIRDYYYSCSTTNSPNSTLSSSSRRQQELVIVVKSKKQVKEFHSKAKKFLECNGLSSASTTGIVTIVPHIATVDEAVPLIQERIAFLSETSIDSGASAAIKSLEANMLKIIAVDLHPEAYTLGGEGAVYNHNFAAIMWGFESDGIPPLLTELATDWVQIESRTSVNVVVAVSILLHVIFSVD